MLGHKGFGRSVEEGEVVEEGEWGAAAKNIRS